jgi:hypothetical protein
MVVDRDREILDREQRENISLPSGSQWLGSIYIGNPSSVKLSARVPGFPLVVDTNPTERILEMQVK